jgi:hypothetical protein
MMEVTRAEQVRYRFHQNVFEDCRKELERVEREMLQGHS